MSNIIDKEALIGIIAERSNFAKKDVRVILDTLIEVMIDAVRNGWVFKVRNFGKLHTQIIPPRKGRDGIDLPEAKRVTFRLAETIRYAGDQEEYE